MESRAEHQEEMLHLCDADMDYRRMGQTLDDRSAVLWECLQPILWEAERRSGDHHRNTPLFIVDHADGAIIAFYFLK